MGTGKRMIKCPHCGNVKSREGYYRKRRGPAGLQPYCKECADKYPNGELDYGGESDPRRLLHNELTALRGHCSINRITPKMLARKMKTTEKRIDELLWADERGEGVNKEMIARMWRAVLKLTHRRGKRVAAPADENKGHSKSLKAYDRRRTKE